MKTETKKWMGQAKEDLQVAKYNFKGRKWKASLFYSQQASEKALKAVQIELLNRFDKIHDLVLLAQKAGAPQEISEICKRLTSAYTYTRYTDVMTEKGDMKAKAENFIKGAGATLKWAKSRT